MMNPSAGTRIVLTGGPCAGKTTLSQMIERAFHNSVVSVPEAASILFSGGFPRFKALEARRATQRAIYSVQKSLETSYGAQFSDRVLVFDRGTVDGAAYWPEGTEAFFQDQGTTLETELARYTGVIYLESAGREDYVQHKSKNPNRIETWEEAKQLDQETRKLWERHPSFTLVRNSRSFERKVLEVLAAVAVHIKFEGGDEQK